MTRQAKAGISEGSHAAINKMLACLNHGKSQGADYQRHRNYFIACGRWWNHLTPGQRETALTVIDAYTHGRKDAAAQLAAGLPAAPECPAMDIDPTAGGPG